jgi:ribonuclease D
MSNFSIEFIKDQNRLPGLMDRLCLAPVIALDIETVNWWNRHQEQVALIQIAYRSEGKTKVAVVDSLAKLDLEVLRRPLELPSVIKIIHNAPFDASKLAKHFKFRVTPVYDTMAGQMNSTFTASLTPFIIDKLQ